MRSILRLEPEEDAWLRDCWRPATQGRNPVFGRLDALVDYSSPVWKDMFKFVEPNLTGIGGLHLIPSVEEILSEIVVPLIVAQDAGLRLERLADAANCSTASSWPSSRRSGARGDACALVEPKYELEGIDEQRRLVEYLQDRHGMETVHAYLNELRMKGAEVDDEDARVDLVYRDYSARPVEIEREGVDATPMRTLFRENRVISSIGGELDHKASWEILTDPELAGRHFDEASAAAFSATSCGRGSLSERRTTLPGGDTGDLIGYARDSRETLVLSPRAGTEAMACWWADAVRHGVGAVLTPRSADEELWVVQALAHIPVLEVPTLSEDGSLRPEMYYHVMGICWTPTGSRLSRGPRSARSSTWRSGVDGGGDGGEGLRFTCPGPPPPAGSPTAPIHPGPVRIAPPDDR